MGGGGSRGQYGHTTASGGYENFLALGPVLSYQLTMTLAMVVWLAINHTTAHFK